MAHAAAVCLWPLAWVASASASFIAAKRAGLGELFVRPPLDGGAEWKP
jgi:hypothetical protein